MLDRALGVLPMGLGGLPLTMLRRAANQCAMLHLLKAESRAKILPEEGQGRERVLWEAAGAKRQREMDTLGSQVSRSPTPGLPGRGGSNGQVGGGYAAVEADQNTTAATAAEAGPGLAAVPGLGAMSGEQPARAQTA